MLIREYRPSDREALLALRAQQEQKWFGSEGNLAGFDASDPSMVLLNVVEDNGKIVAAVGAKLTAEIRMVMNPEGRDLAPFFRNELIPLWARTVADLHRKGFPDCVAFVPSVIKKWGNSLVRRAGFKRSPEAVYSFNVRDAVKAVANGSS